MQTVNVDVLVVGGGPAGLAAAIRAKESGAARVLIVERDKELGGILQQCIHNGFGLHYFGEELTGPEYAQRFIDAFRKTDIELWLDTMVLEITADREALCVGPDMGLARVHAKAVVLAMGCRERTRGALSIPGSRPAGIFTAGCAQRLTNMEGVRPGNKVVILGSGDIGMIMARRMVWEGAAVSMVCELMPYSSGLNRNIVQCLVDNGIPLLFNTTVVRIHGRERLEGVTIAQVDEQRKPRKETERFVECDTLLLSVGLLPENELTRAAGIQMDAVTGGAVVDENRQTSVPGIFACGNVLHVHDLVDHVSDEANIAGAAAARYARGEAQPGERHGIRPGPGVRYVVPQRLSADAAGEIALYFRVDDIYKKARLSASIGDTVLRKRASRIATPGEMERLVIDAGNLPAGDIVVTVEGGA